MKKIFFVLLLLALPYTYSYALGFDEFKVFTKEEIVKLTNEQLVDEYTNAMIERKANEIFHGKAGFTPKEYQKYKELLGYIIHLRQEMTSRAIDVPPIGDWLK